MASKFNRAYLHIAPSALYLMGRVPANIVGTKDCDGVCVFVIEGEGLEEGARYICSLNREPLRMSSELRKVP